MGNFWSVEREIRCARYFRKLDWCWCSFLDIGDLVYANVAGSDIIVLNSIEAATSVLDNKGAIYSDRPSAYFIGTMVGFSEGTTLLNEGPRLKEQRKLFSQWLGNKSTFEHFIPTIEARIRRCLCQLID
jgi:cytochrome P450